MGDPDVWAPDMWNTMAYVAHAADCCAKMPCKTRGGELHKAAVCYFQLLTRTLPCEPCRRYYTHHLAGFLHHQRSSPHTPLSLLDFVHSMRCFVYAKIDGTSGKTIGSTSGNVLQLRKRFMTLGVSHISTDGMLQSLMLLTIQAWRCKTLCKEPPEKILVRAHSIVCLIVCLIIIMQFDRQGDARRWNVVMKQHPDIIRYSPKKLFACLYGMLQRPAMKCDTLWDVMRKGTFTKKVDWWLAQSTARHPSSPSVTFLDESRSASSLTGSVHM